MKKLFILIFVLLVSLLSVNTRSAGGKHHNHRNSNFLVSLGIANLVVNTAILDNYHNYQTIHRGCNGNNNHRYSNPCNPCNPVTR